MRNFLRGDQTPAFNHAMQLASNLIDELTFDDIEPLVAIAVSVKRRSFPWSVIGKRDTKTTSEV